MHRGPRKAETGAGPPGDLKFKFPAKFFGATARHVHRIAYKDIAGDTAIDSPPISPSVLSSSGHKEIPALSPGLLAVSLCLDDELWMPPVVVVIDSFYLLYSCIRDDLLLKHSRAEHSMQFCKGPSRINLLFADLAIEDTQQCAAPESQH